MAVQRLCGYRVAGGIYLECGLSPVGEPLEYFLLDPPIRFDKDKLGISAIGVKPFTKGGVTHVADWVGAEHYPGPKSFLEEVRRLGLSRRIPKTFPFETLTRESRIYIAHPKGWNKRFAALMKNDNFTCPKKNAEHAWDTDYDPEGNRFAVPPDEMCSGIWWDPAFDIAKDGYHPAFIAIFPITNLAVVYGQGHEEALAAAERANIPVYSEVA